MCKINTIFFLPHFLPTKERENIRKMAFHFGYKIVTFADSIKKLKTEMKKWNPYCVMIWDTKSVDQFEKKFEFYSLMSQTQTRFYDFMRGHMHHPWGILHFKREDLVGHLINEEVPLHFYSIHP